MSRLIATLGMIILLTAMLSGCTRERDPWSVKATASWTDNLPITPTATSTATPNISAVPAFTPHVTTEPGPGSDNSAPVSERGIPPMPGNETLTPKPPTPTPVPKFFTYRVRAGESLYTIAAKFNVSVATIKQYNELVDPNTLRVGQELKIPEAIPSDQENGEEDGGYVHVVKPGETLYGIAQQYSIPLDELAALNNITNPSTIRPGQKLRIPVVSETQSSESDVRIHIVRPGEALSTIAIQYGVTPQDIIDANDISDPSRIYSGQKLTIP